VNFTPDALRVVMALFDYESWSVKRIARLFKVEPRDIDDLIKVVREYQSSRFPKTRCGPRPAHPPSEVQDDFF
jgi:hypothetical protein